MPAITQAEHFFEEWASDPVSAFEFVTAQFGDPLTVLAESEWLDYKDGSSLWFKDQVKTKPEDRRNKIKEQLSELTSAFSNTAGGLIIWGVKCGNKIPTGPSYAQDVFQHANDCENLVREVVDPPVSGARFLAVPDPSRSPAGFVVAHIPQSRFLPHRAAFGERTFWMRAIDSCIPIPTGMLRTMFHPVVSPRCCIEANCTVHINPNGSQFLSPCISLRIINRGNSTAENVIVRILGLSTGTRLSFQTNSGSSLESNERAIHVNRMIHPEEDIAIGYFLSEGNVSRDDFLCNRVKLSVTIYARNSLPISWRAVIPDLEIRKFEAETITGMKQICLSFEVSQN